MFCANQDLDFSELRDAVNTKWNENIMEAREGIGGHCLPKDTKMYYELSKHLLPSSIVSVAMKSNDLYEGFCKQDFIFIEPIELVTVNSLKKERSLGVT